jgi:hypothetical protein
MRPKPQTILLAAFALLGARVLAGIVWEYRRYFPPDFDAAFLIGREETFTPLYAAAFYAHILSGPPAILLAAFLLLSSGRTSLRTAHRCAGRILGLLLLVMLPSGWLMAFRAFAGPWAGAGFTALALTTGFTAMMTISLARRRKFAQHQQWAIRLFLLLVSPLILRVASGALTVSGWDTPGAYVANAWLSWLLPLVGYEIWLLVSARPQPVQANA